VAKSDDNGNEMGTPVSLVAGQSKASNVLELPLAGITFPLNLKLHVKSQEP
jgi:hypothetical protein